MGLPIKNSGKDKQGKNQKNNTQGSKFISKPGKGPSVAKKANRTGGTRGS